MTDVRIQTFPIPGLEYVFVPPGLPLVTKSESGPTTSILVRGGAGTGKTTLAVALAHAISKTRDGIALYLTTEFVATEIPYKAATLHLPENSAVPWDHTGEHDAGTILARHLLQTHAGENEQSLRTVGARKRAAIAAVWESLTTGGEPSAERAKGRPVRAVVLDAFGLPEAESEDPGLRNELLTLVQSLEYLGITVILIEEASTPSQTWLSFVVDIVFETELSSGDDTGNLLLRRLKCPKSRYGQALPGPHDYGLDVSTGPSVWPDLAFSNTWASLRREENRAPTFLVPQGDRFGLYPAGSVMISDWSDERPFVHAVDSLPGMKIADLSCGPLMTLSFDEGEDIHMGEGQGVFAVVWHLIQAYHAGRVNTVLMKDFEFFLAHPLTRSRSLRAVAMLSAAGLTVFLHGDTDALSQAAVIANCVQGGKYFSNEHSFTPRARFCRADRWLPRLVDPNVDAFGQALTAHLSGHFAAARAHAKKLSKSDALPVYFMLIGDELAAADLIRPTPRYPKHMRMWANLAAIHAENVVALENLAKDSGALDVHDTIALLRALAANQQGERLLALIRDCGTRWNLPAWYTARLHAELLSDALDAHELINPALLEACATSDDVPSEHRAEIWYNIGVLHRERGDLDAAQAANNRVLELNPEFDLATGP
jgi:KaiC/GvpD/RAD55 family RecA-like ATPase